MANYFRCDAEFIRDVKGSSGVMYSVRIQEGDRTGLEEGVPNGTFVKIGDLETGEREIRKAVKPVDTELPGLVIRGEVNYAQDYKTDNLWGKFRNNVANPLPVAKLSVGDFIGLSEDYFPADDIASIAVGHKYILDTVGGFAAGTQLKKEDSPTTGQVVFEVVEVKANHTPVYLLGDGKLTQPYKMIFVKIKVAE